MPLYFHDFGELFGSVKLILLVNLLLGTKLYLLAVIIMKNTSFKWLILCDKCMVEINHYY